MAKIKTQPVISLPFTTNFIERRIYLIRGQKVMLDGDLAELYRVPTKVFNQAVKRNINRFPSDFMFQLSSNELKNWRSQIVTSNLAAKMGLRRPPYAFTEQGIAMLSSVLNSDYAIKVNIAIMRAFVQLRKLLSSNKNIITEIKKLKKEQQFQRTDIKRIFLIIEKLLTPHKLKPHPIPPKQPIGFRTK
jgi:hypothetical protein